MGLFQKILRLRHRPLSMGQKMSAGLLAVGFILLISSIISILEYGRMSNYVSCLISSNIKSLSTAREFSNELNSYNLSILKAIGNNKTSDLVKYDEQLSVKKLNDLKLLLKKPSLKDLVDSVLYSNSAYLLISKELPSMMSKSDSTVLKSDFKNTKQWYFNRLQPVYDHLCYNIDSLNHAIYEQLKKNSSTFERGFYRSMIPGVVAVLVGFMLVLLLLFYVQVYYVRPIKKMLVGLDNYRSVSKKYDYSFDGDDELSELNSGIVELANENQMLQKRNAMLKSKLSNKPQDKEE